MKNITKFLSEIFMLKREERRGFKLIDAPQDNLAEHICLTAQIAYVLGEMEGLSGEKCASIALFHDNGEARVGDSHKIASRYVEMGEPEWNALKEQLDNLPVELKNKILALVEQKEKRDTKEGIVVQDADWLEVALQAKILSEHGYKGAEVWINNVEKALETESAKKILTQIREMDDFINCWWIGQEKMTYRKLKK